jgi:hypothetical protein
MILIGCGLWVWVNLVHRVKELAGD